MIYHIAGRGAWAEAQTRGFYCAPSLDIEGFIHCSTRHQILGVANDFYRGRADLLLLCIDENLLGAPLVWETPAHPNPNQVEQAADDCLFPHIYGVLNLDAVIGAFDFGEARTGFALPPDLP
ncbi:MAG: DUF952 domain-containing protein [Chloroflexota bacterium]|nr:DUF952 domain-containing protein [Chloroflexota bacterium]